MNQIFRIENRIIQHSIWRTGWFALECMNSRNKSIDSGCHVDCAGFEIVEFFKRNACPPIGCSNKEGCVGDIDCDLKIPRSFWLAKLCNDRVIEIEFGD